MPFKDFPEVAKPVAYAESAVVITDKKGCLLLLTHALVVLSLGRPARRAAGKLELKSTRSAIKPAKCALCSAV